MIVGVQGTSSFDNYNVFLRSMAVALSELKEEDKVFHVYSARPNNISMMAMEFSNLYYKLIILLFCLIQKSQYQKLFMYQN